MKRENMWSGKKKNGKGKNTKIFGEAKLVDRQIDRAFMA